METEIKTGGRSILKKLHAIMKDCAYIQKDKANEFHKYRYASEAAIKEKLHAAMVEHGVLPQFNIVALTEREIQRFKDGKPQTPEWATSAQMYYRFTCVETGEYVDGTFFGCGVDPADKGVYKATTGAIKYILTSQFLIATGDDPENESAGKHERLKRSAAKIDTAGQPLGTKEAAQAVADRKVGNYEMLNAFKAVKGDFKKIDREKKYYDVLGAHGFEHANEIKDREQGKRIFKELQEAHKAEMENLGVSK